LNAFYEERSGVRYWRALREHWLLIAALVVAAVAAAAVYSLTAQKRYRASTDVLVTPIAANDTTFVGIPVLRETTQSRSVVTAARLIKTHSVAQGVKDRLHLDKPTGRILASIEVQPQEQSNIVTIVATAGTPKAAAALANGFANTVVAQRSAIFQKQLNAVIQRLQGDLNATPSSQANSGESVAIQQRLGELASLVGSDDPTLQVASPAVPPAAPYWPRPVLSIAVAFLAAVLVGAGAALALEFANPLLRREDELVERRLPILTRIPRMSRGAARDYLVGREPLPPDLRESYRVLRATVATAGPDGDTPRSILVASASPGEAKTFTAVSLAIAFASSGLRVILVDGDLRRPMVSTLMHVPAGGGGLSDLAESGLVTPTQVLTTAPGYGDNLRLVLARPHHSARVDVLRPDQIKRVLQELESACDVVILDSPPLTEVADALTFSEVVDAVLFTIFLGRTRRDKLNDSLRMLGQVGANVLGFVVVSRTRSKGSSYYYGSVEEEAVPEPQTAGSIAAR
jgi:capsular exopolysaccharide synthesis family protein